MSAFYQPGTGRWFTSPADAGAAAVASAAAVTARESADAVSFSTSLAWKCESCGCTATQSRPTFRAMHRRAQAAESVARKLERSRWAALWALGRVRPVGRHQMPFAVVATPNNASNGAFHHAHSIPHALAVWLERAERTIAELRSAAQREIAAANVDMRSGNLDMANAARAGVSKRAAEDVLAALAAAVDRARRRGPGLGQ